MEFKPADVGFCITHTNWVSRAIAWFTGSKWSHAFLVKEITPKHTYIQETNSFCVTIDYLESHIINPDQSIEIWSPIDISDSEREEIVEEAYIKTYGYVYGYMQLISFGIRRLLMRIGIKINNFFRQGVVCDHVVSYGYKKSSIPELTNIDPESIDSEELYQIVITCGKFKKIYEK